jgi:ABC-type glycerol-3-phosphate transport system substrate-binding protein
MDTRFFRFLSFMLLVAMVGCTSLPFSLGGGSQVTPTSTEGILLPTASSTLNARQTETPITPEETGVATQPIGGSMVRIWLPPEFDPEGSSPASSLLKPRLEQFAAENPNIRLEVRVKTIEGAGGLLESLVAANVAAPIALPDLVLLPRPLLESAALKGLLYPYDGISSIMDDPNWYEYARQLAHVQSSTYGIPFAGDALVLAYHPSLLEKPSFKLEDTLSLGEAMLYPATDPQALFTLCLYMAENGSLQDEQGRPSMDVGTLTKILEFDQRASLAGVMPFWLTQYSNDAQVWEAFQGGQYPMAVTWASTYLSHLLTDPDDLGVIYLPTVSGTPYTLATGWSWALAGQDPERRALAVKLAEYLVDKEFLGKWTYAAGYLPPKGIPLQYWPDAGLRTNIADISISASLVPPANVLSDLGPAIEQAVVDVLKAQSDPQTAAQAVIDQINQP